MELSVREALSSITTVRDMVRAFQNESYCRRLLEAMVWPNGRVCPACGYRRSIALMGRENGKRARPGLYQCSSGDCRSQFTVTTRTPLHATKLPLRVWLSGLWLMLQSDKGLSSIRLAEALGVSQPTAWRMGHALRLMVGREQALDGVVEIDGLYVGGQAAAGSKLFSTRAWPQRPAQDLENTGTCGRAAAAGCEHRRTRW